MDGRLTAMEAAGGLGVSSFPGHVLGMPHDDSKLCTRLFGPLDKHHMMAPLYVQLNKTRPWSPAAPRSSESSWTAGTVGPRFSLAGSRHLLCLRLRTGDIQQLCPHCPPGLRCSTHSSSLLFLSPASSANEIICRAGRSGLRRSVGEGGFPQTLKEWKNVCHTEQRREPPAGAVHHRVA